MLLHSFPLIKGSHQSEPLKIRPRLEASTPASVGTALCEAIKRIKINYGAVVPSSDTQVRTFDGCIINGGRGKRPGDRLCRAQITGRGHKPLSQGDFCKPDAMSPKGKRRRPAATSGDQRRRLVWELELNDALVYAAWLITLQPLSVFCHRCVYDVVLKKDNRTLRK